MREDLRFFFLSSLLQVVMRVDGVESGTLGRGGVGVLWCIEPYEFSSVPNGSVNVIRMSDY